MDRNDQQAIQGLFEKLADVERQGTPRDDEAEAFIRNQIARQPGAPYYMAQTIVVQEQALATAQARIEELENSEASQPAGGGLLGGLFGGGEPRRRSSGAVPRVGRSGAAMSDDESSYRGASPFGGQRGGGGFLAGAAQTAMGVAGGVLLGSAIGGMFGGGGEAQASETDAGGADNTADLGDAGFDGGDMGDMDF